MSEKISDLIVILAARNNRHGQLDPRGHSRASAACRLITGLMRNRRGARLIADGGFGPTFRQYSYAARLMVYPNEGDILSMSNVLIQTKALEVDQ